MRRFGLRLILESKRGLQGVQTLQTDPRLEIQTPKLDLGSQISKSGPQNSNPGFAILTKSTFGHFEMMVFGSIFWRFLKDPQISVIGIWRVLETWFIHSTTLKGSRAQDMNLGLRSRTPFLRILKKGSQKHVQNDPPDVILGQNLRKSTGGTPWFFHFWHIWGSFLDPFFCPFFKTLKNRVRDRSPKFMSWALDPLRVVLWLNQVSRTLQIPIMEIWGPEKSWKKVVQKHVRNKISAARIEIRFFIKWTKKDDKLGITVTPFQNWKKGQKTCFWTVFCSFWTQNRPPRPQNRVLRPQKWVLQALPKGLDLKNESKMTKMPSGTKIWPSTKIHFQILHHVIFSFAILQRVF